MNSDHSITYQDFTPKHAEELVLMWRASFERAVRVKDPHPLAEQQEFLLNKIVPDHQVRLAFIEGLIVGFIAATDESISQLYIHNDYQGIGIGTQLLNWAKSNSNGRLWLYTFEKNKRAQLFYERQGFNIIERGFEEVWQLNDFKYEWSIGSEV